MPLTEPSIEGSQNRTLPSLGRQHNHASRVSSRAAGTVGPDSDGDFAVYYRSAGFDPASVRSLDWPGEILAIGGRGGGVFNGAAWPTAGTQAYPANPQPLRRVVICRDQRLAPAGLAAVCGPGLRGRAGTR